MEINTLLFDLDGTLTDPREGITRSIAFALEKIGRPAPSSDSLNWCIGPPLHDSFRKMLGDEALVQQAVAFYRERYSAIGMYENRVYPGIPEALAELRNLGYQLKLATSKWNAIAAQVIRHFGLDPYFDALYGSESDGTRSDKGELIAHILLQEKLSRDACVMVGDREHDMIGARKNRMKGVGVEWGYGSREELIGAGASRTFSAPAELPLIGELEPAIPSPAGRD